MLEIASKRVVQLQANGFPNAAIYDPPGVGGTSVVTVLAHGDRPELYGLPRDPAVPLAVRLWKGPLKWIGNLAMLGGVLGVFVHYVRFGRKDLEATKATDLKNGGTKPTGKTENT
jgi:formate dehydrogenase iron-sulfur subunit